jgi:pilus assembly protein Flp/PilA
LDKRRIIFLKDEEGVTAIEYALIATLIALSILVSAGLLGTGVEGLFDDVATEVTKVLPLP